MPTLSFEAWKQLGLFGIEIAVVAVLLMVLFRLRHRFGLSPLFATLGVFQYLQVMLALSLYIEVVPGALVSPGSAVLFSGSLYCLLLVFLRESTSETRTLVYGLLAANLVLSGLSLIFSRHLNSPLLRNPYALPEELFRLDVRVMVVGTLVLVLDMVLMIFLYQALESRVRSVPLRVTSTLSLVLLTDSLLFTTGAFWGQPFYFSALAASAVAKVTAAVVYSGFLVAYLSWIEPSPTSGPTRSPTEALRAILGRDPEGLSLERPLLDPSLGTLTEARFLNVLEHQIRLEEQLDSELLVCVFRPRSSSPAESDQGEREAILFYLLAVLHSNLGERAIYGRSGSDRIVAMIPGASRDDLLGLGPAIAASIAGSLRKIRPTPKTHQFKLDLGSAHFPSNAGTGIELIQIAADRCGPVRNTL